ncbi:hypothetical protein D3Z60_18060 [Lachnospiraceae bacterium]|jgi:DNA-directed RNA polymerase subunit RPC12/RpoP|nr:hypothetical protein [Lachnospiraceae bacterium]
MNIYAIKKFTYQCTQCNTGVRFDVPEINEVEKLEELSKAIDELRCPLCKTALYKGASKALKSIIQYNEATHELLKSRTTVNLVSDTSLQNLDK